MDIHDLKNVKFCINQLSWVVSAVPEDNEGLKADNEGETVLGRTYYKTCHIYIDEALQPALFRQTLIHELVHAFTFSYGVHLKADETDEEVAADFFSSHADEIIASADLIIKKFKEMEKRYADS